MYPASASFATIVKGHQSFGLVTLKSPVGPVETAAMVPDLSSKWTTMEYPCCSEIGGNWGILLEREENKDPVESGWTWMEYDTWPAICKKISWSLNTANFQCHSFTKSSKKYLHCLERLLSHLCHPHESQEWCTGTQNDEFQHNWKSRNCILVWNIRVGIWVFTESIKFVAGITFKLIYLGAFW